MRYCQIKFDILYIPIIERCRKPLVSLRDFRTVLPARTRNEAFSKHRLEGHLEIAGGILGNADFDRIRLCPIGISVRLCFPTCVIIHGFIVKQGFGLLPDPYGILKLGVFTKPIILALKPYIRMIKTTRETHTPTPRSVVTAQLLASYATNTRPINSLQPLV